MKISKIEFENFRNFREKGCITFPTDGSMTIIYGPNGVGKTTLHQLFQWIFFGEVHFNKTASDKMYNLQFAKEAPLNAVFSVSGKIDFEHPNYAGEIEYFSLHRTWTYKKELKKITLKSATCRLLKLVGDDWKKVSDEPQKIIELILPIGLSQYFFFDGESMIADLNQKGKDSAKNLRKALYSIFDLNIYEHAITHIGTQTSGTSTVLGKLFLSRSENSTSKDVIEARGYLRQAQKKVEDTEGDIKTASAIIEEKKKEIQRLSELIGSTPQKSVLEARRKKAKDRIKKAEQEIADQMKLFGKAVMENYPNLLLARVVDQAQYRIGLKVEDVSLMPGLNKQLLLSLLKEDTCICGQPLGQQERDKINDLLKLFPPLSYKYIYDQFKNSSKRWAASYNKDALFPYLEKIFALRSEIADLLSDITDIDNELKHSENKDHYIDARKKEEDALREWEKKLATAEQQQGVNKRILQQRKKKYDELTKASEENKIIDQRIELMEAVKIYFESVLQESTKKYSESLSQSIQSLLNQMLTSVRFVSMSPKFELSVRDSYGDEAKSEGQFAVVSFAYIGGIFKLISEVDALKGKQFPLILDGPFSKLDVIQRQNVLNTIPHYAPQVILFSKDDLSECLGEDNATHIWTIYSNDERNVSEVKSGYDKEVFLINGTNE